MLGSRLSLSLSTWTVFPPPPSSYTFIFSSKCLDSYQDRNQEKPPGVLKLKRCSIKGSFHSLNTFIKHLLYAKQRARQTKSLSLQVFITEDKKDIEQLSTRMRDQEARISEQEVRQGREGHQ